jgi:hypothetical protein
LALACADSGKSAVCPQKNWPPPATSIGRISVKSSADTATSSLHNVLRIARTLGVDAGELMHGL